MLKPILTVLFAALALATAAFAQAAGTATVSWTDNSNNETDWRLERAPGLNATSGFTEIVIPSTTIAGTGSTVQYVDNSVTAGSPYSYRVRAHNDGGYSAYSNTASGVVNSPLPPPPAAPSGTQLKTPTPVATYQISAGSQYTFAAFNGKPFNNGPYKSLPAGAYLLAAYALQPN